MVDAKNRSAPVQPSVLAGSVTDCVATVRVPLPDVGLNSVARNPAATHAARAPSTDSPTTFGTVRQLLAGGGGGVAGGPVGQFAKQP